MYRLHPFGAPVTNSGRPSNPIESTFATVKHRTKKSKGCHSYTTIMAMVFKLIQSAEKRWRKLRGFKLVAEVIEGVNFKDGVRVDKESEPVENDCVQLSTG